MTDLLLMDRSADGMVATLTLNRPDKRNALSIALRDRISETLESCARDQELRVLVITGAGPTFSAGFDLAEFETAASDTTFNDELWASSDRYHAAMATFPLPTIAAVNGPALAGGFDLAILCDLRVVATTTRFAHPERTFGDVVYGPLRELVGGAAARDLLLTGRTVDAAEAGALGLATTVVEPDAVLATAHALARQIAETPRPLLLRHKAKILRHARVPEPLETLEL